MASKSLKTTIWHYMAHFGPFRTSNMAVIRPSGGHISLKMTRTYPEVLQIPTTGIATSHMLYPYGLEIAQNRSKPLYGTIWHYMAHFGPFRTSNMAVIRPSGGLNSLKMPRTYPKVLQIPLVRALLSLAVTCCTHTASKSLKMLISSSILRLSQNSAPIGISPGITAKHSNVHK